MEASNSVDIFPIARITRGTILGQKDRRSLSQRRLKFNLFSFSTVAIVRLCDRMGTVLGWTAERPAGFEPWFGHLFRYVIRLISWADIAYLCWKCRQTPINQSTKQPILPLLYFMFVLSIKGQNKANFLKNFYPPPALFLSVAAFVGWSWNAVIFTTCKWIDIVDCCFLLQHLVSCSK